MIDDLELTWHDDRVGDADRPSRRPPPDGLDLGTPRALVIRINHRDTETQRRKERE